MSISPPLLLPLNGVVEVTVSRIAGGSWIKGVWTADSPESLQIKANIQPVLKSTDTMILPEAERSKEAIKVYTTSPLYQRLEGSSPREGDIISWDGKLFEVRKVSEYKMGILNHFKAIAVRKEIT
jgi:hypothetical protein